MTGRRHTPEGPVIHADDRAPPSLARSPGGRPLDQSRSSAGAPPAAEGLDCQLTGQPVYGVDRSARGPPPQGGGPRRVVARARVGVSRRPDWARSEERAGRRTHTLGVCTSPSPPHDEGLLDVGDGQRLHYEVRGTRPAFQRGSPRRSGMGCAPGGRGSSTRSATASCSSTSAAPDGAPRRPRTPTPTCRSTRRLISWRTSSGCATTSGSSAGSSSVAPGGPTLGLTYAMTHPERVRAVVLGAVTLTRAADVEWLTRGVGRYFPEAHERFLAALPSRTAAGASPPHTPACSRRRTRRCGYAAVVVVRVGGGHREPRRGRRARGLDQPSVCGRGPPEGPSSPRLVG